jgi:hypothetical protein
MFMDSRLRGNDEIGWTHCTLVLDLGPKPTWKGPRSGGMERGPTERSYAGEPDAKGEQQGGISL